MKAIGLITHYHRWCLFNFLVVASISQLPGPVIGGTVTSSSSLIKIACSRNPSLNFCGNATIHPVPEKFSGESEVPENADEPFYDAISPEQAGEIAILTNETTVLNDTIDIDITKEGGSLLSRPLTDGDAVINQEEGNVTQIPLLSATLQVPRIPARDPSTGNFVSVYITKNCVLKRKDFLTKCRQSKIADVDLELCKTYPLSCQYTEDTDSVLPLLAYCERYIAHYIKFCSPAYTRSKHEKRFCKAYDQFCVPPPTPQDVIDSQQNLQSCKDIQGEARQVCNPMPPESDRFNHLRCSQFVKYCKEYVDWQ